MTKKAWMDYKKSELCQQVYTEIKEEFTKKLQETEEKILLIVKSKLKNEILLNIGIESENKYYSIGQIENLEQETALWAQVKDITEILNKLEILYKNSFTEHRQPSLLKIAETEEALKQKK